MAAAEAGDFYNGRFFSRQIAVAVLNRRFFLLYLSTHSPIHKTLFSMLFVSAF